MLPAPPPGGGVPQVPRPDRQSSAGGPRHSSGAGQLRHSQDGDDECGDPCERCAESLVVFTGRQLEHEGLRPVLASTPAWFTIGWLASRASTCTSRPRVHPGSTRSNGGSRPCDDRRPLDRYLLSPFQQIRRGTHRSTEELEQAIEEYLRVHNEHPKPFIWTKSADQILESLKIYCELAQFLRRDTSS